MEVYNLKGDLAGMTAVLALARRHLNDGGVPIAAQILDQFGSVIASSDIQPPKHEDVLGHAELACLNQLRELSPRVEGSRLTIYITLEPCPMCAWALRTIGIGRIVFGAYNPKYGAAGSVFDLVRWGLDGPTSTEVVGGVLGNECGALLSEFFSAMR